MLKEIVHVYSTFLFSQIVKTDSLNLHDFVDFLSIYKVDC